MAKNKDIIKNPDLDIPEGYLTLKEASELTDYTPDYIGQLVRAGKIEGRQVYSNVSWVTSESSLRSYLSQKGKEIDLPSAPVADLPEFARPLLYIVIGCTVMFLIILLHVFSLTIDRAISQSYEEKASAPRNI